MESLSREVIGGLDEETAILCVGVFAWSRVVFTGQADRYLDIDRSGVMQATFPAKNSVIS